MAEQRPWRFDPAAPGFSDDPYRYYAALREHDPVHWSPLGFWVVTRYADVRSIGSDLRLSNDLRRYRHYDAYVEARGGPDNPASRHQREWLSQMDPPRHTRLRRLIGHAFAGRLQTEPRETLNTLADRLIDEPGEDEQLDLVRDVAHPFSVLTICRLLGVPDADFPLFRDWALHRAEAVRLEQTRATVDQGNAAASALSEYFHRLVRYRRRHPGDDLVTMLASVADTEGPLTEDELVGACTLLLAAGHEAAANFIGNALFTLFCHPAALARLRADPSLLATAVEELARFESPLQFATRIATHRIQLGQTTIPPGDIVMLGLGAANRDPGRFPDPERFDLDRADNQHLAFSTGIHACLGARLARQEGPSRDLARPAAPPQR